MNWPFDIQKKRKQLVLVALLSLFAVNSSSASDGFTCYDRIPSIAEKIDSANGVVFARWVSCEPEQPKPARSSEGTTQCEIVEILKDSSGTLEPAMQVELPFRVEGTLDETLLLYRERIAESERWYAMRVSAEAVDYIRDLPGIDAPVHEQLRYLTSFMEDADPVISKDAWLGFYEIHDRDFDDIADFAVELDREVLLARVLDPNTDPQRLGTYGMLLGYCGTEQDAERLEEMILRPTDSLRLGIDGVMSAYLMLEGESGLELLEHEKLSNPDAPFCEFYAAFQAVRFMWDHGRDRIPGERLTAAIRPILDNPELADLTIADLGRWSDWSVIDRLYGMYDAEGYEGPVIKRAIIRYMLLARYAASTMEGNEGVELMQKASGYLAEFAERDPVAVENAKRYIQPPGAETAPSDSQR